jgi:hypothetical protein
MSVTFPDTFLEAAWLASYFVLNFVVTYAIARRRHIQGWALLLGFVLIAGPLYLATFLPPEDSTGRRERLRFRLQNRFNKHGWLLAVLTYVMFIFAIGGGGLTLGALFAILIGRPIVYNGQETNHLVPKLIGLLIALYFLSAGLFYFRKVRPRVRSLARSGWPEGPHAG